MVTDHRTINPGELSAIPESGELWKSSISLWLLLIGAFGVTIVVFSDGIENMIGRWTNREEYSHGFMLPLISVFLIWQKSNTLRNIEFTGSWPGFGLVALSLLLFVLGELSSLYIIIQYAFLIAVAGFVLALTGNTGFRQLWIPLFFLAFMIPLPHFLYNNLSLQLQLVSSALGVEFIRFCDISVFLEGNVIDLGHYQLHVVDACSGLRYLFPFMSLSFLCAYVYREAFWKRAVIFLSSLPITVFMNSFRIGVIGVLVENFGQSAAEGFLHYFEGWVIFLFCMALLLIEMRILAWVGKPPKSFAEVFNLAFPGPAPRGSNYRERPIPLPAIASLVLLSAALALPGILDKAIENPPARKSFTEFPLRFGPWRGRSRIMEQKFQDQLKLDDYLLADYEDRKGRVVNYYVAYYASQSKGRSIHSPRSCLPGGGWKVTNLPGKAIASGDHRKTEVARVLIQQGETRQLVYFWTQQRGRVINNEFLIKWYLFRDALDKRRSDGALIRLTTPLEATEDLHRADQRLAEFAELAALQMKEFVPD